MLTTLGRPEQAFARRRTRVQDLARLDAEMSSLESEDGKPSARREGEERVTSSNEERVEMRDGRRQPHPQSCTLEQLYHEALPLEKALSHSGPPTFPNVGSAISLGSTEEAASVISFTSSVHRFLFL
jgi:hypothetical protein